VSYGELCMLKIKMMLIVLPYIEHFYNGSISEHGRVVINTVNY